MTLQQPTYCCFSFITPGFVSRNLFAEHLQNSAAAIYDFWSSLFVWAKMRNWCSCIMQPSSLQNQSFNLAGRQMWPPECSYLLASHSSTDTKVNTRVNLISVSPRSLQFRNEFLFRTFSYGATVLSTAYGIFRLAMCGKNVYTFKN